MCLCVSDGCVHGRGGLVRLRMFRCACTCSACMHVRCERARAMLSYDRYLRAHVMYACTCDV
eukprot:2368417-Pleurochrysis_carterae.AAC.1